MSSRYSLSLAITLAFGCSSPSPPAADLVLTSGRTYTLETDPIAPGKLADLAMFDADPVELGHADPAKLLDARVLYTNVGSKLVYRSVEPPR